MSEDEKALIEAARSDAAAFGRLYDRYIERIYRYAYRRTGSKAQAEDVTAATFERALRNIHQYEWRGVSFVAWLYRIARNEAISQQRRLRWLAPWRQAGASDGRAPERELAANQRRQAVHRALAQLGPKEREVIELRYFEGLSGQETALVLGCTPNAAYVRLHRALQHLEQLLDQDTRWTGVAPSPGVEDVSSR